MEDLHIGKGFLKPLDADEYVGITICEKDGCVERAAYTAGGGETVARCAETVCSVITGHGIVELFQMNNKAVYYNIEPELTLHELYKATIAVTAAKRAAADWCRKNGVAIPEQPDGCGCITE